MPLNVLFIAGCGRSGSTLLSRMLGQVGGFCDIGELHYLWKAGYGRNYPCGCGKAFRECEFWTAVTRAALGDLAERDVLAIRGRLHRIARVRRRPRILQPLLKTPAWRADLRAYGGLLREILSEVQARTSCRVIVDSSKVPPHGLALAAAGDVRLHVVHLVRDPRAMAFSWQRRKTIPNPGGEPIEMYRMGYAKSARYWNRDNHAAAELEDRAESYLLLRYEDLVAAPGATMRTILAPLGAPDADLGFLAGGEVALPPSHSISGNPMRFESGAIPIRPDTEWQDAIDPAGRRTVTRITRRLRERYGYAD
ncbi:MAG TPA: sulfotransferase [Phycisphaerae bacterium]|nr:sulfotransferase [Phycisphaerae bacterium]